MFGATKRYKERPKLYIPPGNQNYTTDNTQGYIYHPPRSLYLYKNRGSEPFPLPLPQTHKKTPKILRELQHYPTKPTTIHTTQKAAPNTQHAAKSEVTKGVTRGGYTKKFTDSKQGTKQGTARYTTIERSSNYFLIKVFHIS